MLAQCQHETRRPAGAAAPPATRGAPSSRRPALLTPHPKHTRNPRPQNPSHRGRKYFISYCHPGLSPFPPSTYETPKPLPAAPFYPVPPYLSATLKSRRGLALPTAPIVLGAVLLSAPIGGDRPKMRRRPTEILCIARFRHRSAPCRARSLPTPIPPPAFHRNRSTLHLVPRAGPAIRNRLVRPTNHTTPTFQPRIFHNLTT